MKPRRGFLAFLAVAALAGCGGSGTSHTTSAPAPAAVPGRSAPGITAPNASPPPSANLTSASTSTLDSSTARPTHSLRRSGHYASTASWRQGALATAQAFVEWFDRWVGGESTARQAPDVTVTYSAKLQASIDNVPPAAKGHVAMIVHLVPAGMPPDAPDPREVWIYTATRSQDVVIQFTVEERLYGKRWLVYDVYQGP